MLLRGMQFALVVMAVSSMAFAGAAHRKMKKEVNAKWKEQAALVKKACGCDALAVNIDWKSYKVDKKKVSGASSRLKSELEHIAKVYTKFCKDDADNKGVACNKANKVTVKVAYGDMGKAKMDKAKKLVWEFTDDSGYSAAYRLKDLVDELD